MPAQRQWLRAFVRPIRPILVAAVALGVLAPATAAHADPSLTQIEQQIASQSAALEKVVEQYNKVNEQLKASRAQADGITAELQPLTVQLSDASARMSELAAVAYKGGGMSEFTALLTATDPSTVVDRLTTLDQITKYQNQQIASFVQTKATHDAEADKLAALVADQTKQQQTLEAQKAKINSDLARLYELRRRAYGSQTTRATAVSATPPNVSGKAGVAVRFAYAQLGKPYAWAADGPGSYDCSGLTLAAWRAAGVMLPHNAEMQWNSLPHIKRSALAPGDLVFYSGLGHVGIYVGSSQIIHSPTFGDHVRLASVDMMTPYGYARPS